MVAEIRMKCVIPGANVKVFGRAIHSLSKIGEELYIEPFEHGLALRTVNSSRSAYACFMFAPSFFLQYDDGSGGVNPGDPQQDSIRCKIGLKSCLAVFKSLSTLEKTVDKCKIKLDMEEARLIFQLYCRHGIVKTYNLAFIECETLQAVFDKDTCPNALTGQSRLLSDVVTNFQTTQEEVSLIVSPEKACFKNYVEDEPDPHKVIHTALSLDPEEFEAYQVEMDTEVTFCLKELRAILGFSEPNNLPISILFETAGRPIVFSMDTDPSFEANFVLATLADKGPSQPTSSQPITTAQLANPAQQSNAATTTSRNDTMRSRKPRNSVSARLDSAYMALAEEEQTASVAVNHTRDTSTKPTNGKAAPQETSRVRPSTSAASDSPVLPVRSHSHKVVGAANTSVQDLCADEDEAEDVVPGTPPSKKFKSMFFGLSQSTTQASNAEDPAPLVLAEDSDEDD